MVIRFFYKALCIIASTLTVLAVLFFIAIYKPEKTSDQLLFDGFSLSLIPLIFISAARVVGRSIREWDYYNGLNEYERILYRSKTSVGRFVRGVFITFGVIIIGILFSGFFL